MKAIRVMAVVFEIVFFSALCFAQDEPCATVGSTANSTQYLNSTITLKILLVEFTDVGHRTFPFEYSRADFENLLVSNDVYVSPNMYTPDGDEVYGSLSDYYRKMSSGNLNLTGYVVNNRRPANKPVWVMLYGTKQVYQNFQRNIFSDAVTAANAQGLDVSTSATVKLAIIYAGNTWFEFGGLNPAAGGNTYIMSELQLRPYTIEDPNARFSRIGTHCHEFAHLIGIDHSSGGRADIMEAGRRNGPDHYGAAPAPLHPGPRAQKGWLTPTVISGQQEFDLYYSLTAPQVFRVNSDNNGDYFLFENRRFTQTMVIGTTTVPDYNNGAFFPPAGPHNTQTQGIFVWRVRAGDLGDYSTNGLIRASGLYDLTWAGENPIRSG